MLQSNIITMDNIIIEIEKNEFPSQPQPFQLVDYLKFNIRTVK